MKRRDALAMLVAVGCITRLSDLRAQSARPARIGWLGFGSAALAAPYIGYFKQGMRSLGHTDGTSYVLITRFSDGRIDQLLALAGDLTRLPVDVILAISTPPALALQKATTTIPVVMVGVGDPVGSGLVKSLARPGGNITGMTNLTADVGGKLVEFIREAVPKVTTVAIMANAANRSHPAIVESIATAARDVGVTPVSVHATNADEIERALAVAREKKVDAVILASDVLFLLHRRQIAETALKHRLPVISGSTENTEAGGLISYGESSTYHLQRIATYVDRILKGAKPSDLPIEQPTKFELVVNMVTARALGIAVPQSLLLRADRVLE